MGWGEVVGQIRTQAGMNAQPGEGQTETGSVQVVGGKEGCIIGWIDGCA